LNQIRLIRFHYQFAAAVQGGLHGLALLTGQEAEQRAKALARAEQDKLKS
jgi:hypothetical protein